MGDSVLSADWSKTTSSRVPAEKGGQANGREMSHTKRMSGTRESLVHENHTWMIGEKTGPRCTTSRKSCRSLKRHSVKRSKSCRCSFLTERTSNQLTEDREIIGESLLFLRHYSDKTMDKASRERRH